MAVLNLAQTGVPLTVDPASTILSYLQTNWTASIGTTSISWQRTYTFWSRNKFAVVVDHLRTKGPPQIIGAGRYRFIGEYTCEILSTGASMDDSKDSLFTIKQEIARIIKTNVLGLTGSGFDEVAIDEFVDSGGKNDQALNNILSADIQTTLAREIATIILTYDGIVT